MTQIYLLRHSEPLKIENVVNSDSLQIQNEKWPLTKNGEDIAYKKSRILELQNFDIVISSNYVRAICTAKYFTDNKIKIIENFGERKFGINSWDELPENYGEKQFNNFDYKLKDGESLNEVIKRQYSALMEILEKYKDKKVLIVGHSTAFASLLSKWCQIDSENGYIFNNLNFFDGKWNYCQCFKLEFNNDKELINIDNI